MKYSISVIKFLMVIFLSFQLGCSKGSDGTPLDNIIVELPNPENQDWVKLRGDKNNSGYSKSWASSELPNLKWKFRTGSEIGSSPVVAN